MPWSVKKGAGKCDDDQYAVVNDDTGQVVPGGCHGEKSEAEAHKSALYANTDYSENKSMFQVPRDDLVRMIPFDVNPQWPHEMVLRMADDGNTLVGYAAVFNRWTEINSWEGRFKEQIKPGAFKRTLGRGGNRDQIKVLFNHGMDPSIGDKPLGKPRTMQEDEKGLYVEVPLDDTSYNRDLKASLKSGALDGMSFRMNVIRDEWDNLDEDVPERTIQEIRLFEFGPVTFPAYQATEAGVRAHAPQAYAAYRAAQHERTRDALLREGFSPDQAVDIVTQDTGALTIGNAVYTPSQWPGFMTYTVSGTSGTTTTTNDITLYARSDDVTQPPPEDDQEDTSIRDEITDVESETATMNPPDDSVDSDPSPEERDNAPVEPDPASVEDDPSESAPSSQALVERMSAPRKAMYLDRIGYRDERDKARARQKFYLDLNPSEEG